MASYWVNKSYGNKYATLPSLERLTWGLRHHRFIALFYTPKYPENYMHRIGRTGRAEEQGESILFFTENEKEAKESIESLMNYKRVKENNVNLEMTEFYNIDKNYE